MGIIGVTIQFGGTINQSDIIFCSLNMKGFLTLIRTLVHEVGPDTGSAEIGFTGSLAVDGELSK